MIQLTDEQMGQLAINRRRNLAQYFSERALSRDPTLSDQYDKEVLTDVFELELNEAHGHGMQSMAMLERWCDIATAVSFGFGTSTVWAMRTLSRTDISPAAKLSKLESASVFAARALEQ